VPPAKNWMRPAGRWRSLSRRQIVISNALFRKVAPHAKQQAIEAIEQLRDNVPLDEIVYRLYVLNKVHQGLDDVDAGRVVSSEALAAEIEQW